MARTTTRKTTPAKRDAAKPPAKKTATPRKTTPAKRVPAKKTTTSRTIPAPPLPVRPRDWMTDTQGFAALAALRAGIPTRHIRDWRDHRNNTATRPHADGTLHYQLDTRTLTWQAPCPMGATHQYVLDGPSSATAARIHLARCTRPHTDLTRIPALTTSELAELGIVQAPTTPKWAIPGEPEVTKSIPVPLPDPKPRVLADTLVHSHTGTTETQPMSHADIAAVIEAGNTAKEHPQP